MFTKTCPTCGKDFTRRGGNSSRARFCSKECQYFAQRGKKLSPENRRKFVEAGYRAWCGRKHTAEARRKMSDTQRGKFGKLARGFRGGRITDYHGYVKVLVPDFRIDKNGIKRQKYIMEHRLVMEKHLGRKLLANEIIHHRNGIKDDNRIENLEIVLRKAHRGKVVCPHCQKSFSIK